MNEATDRAPVVFAPGMGVSGLLDASAGATPQWSVVVIARNEAETIDKSLASVMRVFAGHSYELIFVDSASTDATVEIARRYPARIFRLPETAPLRPSVGRHIGYCHSRGQWILFLDGDNALVNPGWVDAAADAFSTDPHLAGVAGQMENLLNSKGARAAEDYGVFPERDYEAAESLGGSAAYTREALITAGGAFNPFLRSCEEAELGARLRKAGYTMRRLRMPMVQHYHKHPKETTHELLRRMRRGFFTGAGQYPRYCLANRLPVSRPLGEISRPLAFLALLILGGATLIASAISAQWWSFLAWITLMLMVYLLFAIRAGELRKPAYYFLEWGLSCLFVAQGFLERPRKAEQLPDVWRGRSVITEEPYQVSVHAVGTGAQV